MELDHLNYLSNYRVSQTETERRDRLHSGIRQLKHGGLRPPVGSIIVYQYQPYEDVTNSNTVLSTYSISKECKGAQGCNKKSFKSLQRWLSGESPLA